MRNDGLFTDCEVDSDCDDVEGKDVGTDLKCGALFGMDALNGGVTEEVCMPRLNGWIRVVNGLSCFCFKATRLLLS